MSVRARARLFFTCVTTGNCRDADPARARRSRSCAACATCGGQRDRALGNPCRPRLACAARRAPSSPPPSGDTSASHARHAPLATRRACPVPAARPRAAGTGRSRGRGSRSVLPRACRAQLCALKRGADVGLCGRPQRLRLTARAAARAKAMRLGLLALLGALGAASAAQTWLREWKWACRGPAATSAALPRPAARPVAHLAARRARHWRSRGARTSRTAPAGNGTARPPGPASAGALGGGAGCRAGLAGPTAAALRAGSLGSGLRPCGDEGG